MARLLSDQTMRFMAQELGVAGIVANEGWAGVPSRECGRVVQVAVRLAQENFARGALPPSGPFPPRGRQGTSGRR